MKAVTLAMFAVVCASSQTPDTVKALRQDLEDSKAPEVDLSVPESPAFAAMGLTPENVIRPGSTRALATSLLNGVDPNANFQTGIAIDTAPYFLAYGSKITLGGYRRSYTTRFLSRLQLSVATAKGTSENDKAARLGAGLRFTPWDTGDYRMNDDFIKELNALSDRADKDAELMLLKAKVNPAAIAEELELHTTRFLEAREAKIRLWQGPIREKYRKKNWNASSLSLGFAPTWISRTGTTESIAWNGGAAWASMAYGFENVPGLEDTAQIIIHARYRNKDRVPLPDAENQYYIQDSTLAGARARFGGVDSNGSFEVVYLNANPRVLPNEKYLRITGGVERRIVENVWLQFSVGGESGRRDSRNGLLLLTSFKWALGQKQE